MFRVNHRPPDLHPAHQRNFPPRKPPEGIHRNGSADGSEQLALMVACYLVAMCVGLAALASFAPITVPNTTTAEIIAGR